jgi:hypothetical protein
LLGTLGHGESRPGGKGMQRAGGAVTASKEMGQTARGCAPYSAMIPVNRKDAGGNAD